MVDIASNLGGFLPGADPQYLVPGSALHICGTTRAGTQDDGTSVVDLHSKVWRQKDLYLGGCSVVPTQNACNPTLTAACFAIVGAKNIIQEIGKPVAK
jgi:choline dehydrogenase-like flavoprotein